MAACRACGGVLEQIIDLGLQPPSNAFLKARHAPEVLYPLRACVCESCYLMQVDTDVPPKELFGDYVYFSSYSKQWLDHAKAYAEMATKRFSLDKTSFVIEIGSNDGYLLKNFTVPCMGVEPSDTVAEFAKDIGVCTRVAFFSSELRLPKADLVICNNVLGHVPDLPDFVKGLSQTIKREGTITLEFPHVLKLIQGLEFDTIYHEHYSYLSLLALEPLFNRFGLHAYDVEHLPTHGGSLRLYVGRFQSVRPAIDELRKAELPLMNNGTYASFEAQAQRIKSEYLSFAQSHRIVGYGAAAKGNTFLNFCGVSLPYVADITPAKQGKYLPGSHIPVVSEAHLIEDEPEIVLILPWNWAGEIKERLKIIRTWGGKFLTAIPEIRLS